MRKQSFKRKAAALLVGAALCSAGSAFADPLSEKIGVAHTSGNYCLTKRPFLLEGAEQIRSLGSKVIKFSFRFPKKHTPLIVRGLKLPR